MIPAVTLKLDSGKVTASDVPGFIPDNLILKSSKGSVIPSAKVVKCTSTRLPYTAKDIVSLAAIETFGLVVVGHLIKKVGAKSELGPTIVAGCPAGGFKLPGNISKVSTVPSSTFVVTTLIINVLGGLAPTPSKPTVGLMLRP